MQKKVINKRFKTQPTSDKLYQASIRAQSILYVQDSKKKPNRSDILTVKEDNKVQYHCFKRYRTFPYSFDQIIDQHHDQTLFKGAFTINNACEAFMNQTDYMLYCCGSLRQFDEQMPSQTYKIFEDQLQPIFNEFVKNKIYTMRMNIVAVTEDMVYDLISNKSVQLRDISNNNSPNSYDICFMGVQYEEVQTLYQIYTILQSTGKKKSQMFNHSYYVLYCDFTSKNGSGPRRKIVFIDSTKDIADQKKGWDNNSHLVLNKCILGLYGKMENKDSYIPFRDSKVTRIMKPFMSYNSRIDIYGFVNRDDEDTSLQTLNFVRNFARLKVEACQKNQIENPETNQKIQSLVRQNSSIKRKLKTIEKEESPSKLNLFEQIIENANKQRKIMVGVQKSRRLNKLIKTKKWMSKLGLGLGQESEHLKNLQEQQIRHQEQLEHSLLQESAKLNQQRVETINKSISKVQKLQLMKEYFTIALNTQKQETKQFLQQQKQIKQVYEENIKIIQRDLKKSPHQLLGIQMGLTPSKHNKRSSEDTRNSQKRNSAQQLNERSFLPQLNQFQRRKTLVKNKVLKGRVQFQNFLGKNAEQYQSYKTPTKMNK